MVKDESNRILYVNGLMFSLDKEQVAFIKKKRPPFQKGKLNGIGGKIEEQESPIAAMIREFREEAGVDTEKKDWKLFYEIIDRKCHIYFFKAFSLKINELKSITDEEVTVLNTFPLPSNLMDNLSWLVPTALNEEHPSESFE